MVTGSQGTPYLRYCVVRFNQDVLCDVGVGDEDDMLAAQQHADQRTEGSSGLLQEGQRIGQ